MALDLIVLLHHLISFIQSADEAVLCFILVGNFIHPEGEQLHTTIFCKDKKSTRLSLT